MAVVLALVAALAYGTSDFIGGHVSRRAPAWSVAVVVQGAAAVSTALAALIVMGSPTQSDFLWSAVGGLGTGVGVGFLFRGLSAGRMSVVAPLSAVGAALLPAGVGVALGERPSMLVTIGLVLAFPGIWLVAAGEDPPARAQGVGGKGLVDGIVAGLAFGGAFAALGQVDDGAGLWPLTVTQVVSMVVAVGLAVVLKAAWLPDQTALRAAPAGVLSAVALVCFQAAAQSGLLTVASVLAALYPAATILLAMLLLQERVHRGQAVGLLLCGGTVTLVALG